MCIGIKALFPVLLFPCGVSLFNVFQFVHCGDGVRLFMVYSSQRYAIFLFYCRKQEQKELNILLFYKFMCKKKPLSCTTQRNMCKIGAM
jgi:hypothetical protein